MKIIEILKWLFVIIAVISGSRMSSIVRAEKEKSKWFYSVSDVLDYIEITRQQNGKIGGLFWAFPGGIHCFYHTSNCAEAVMLSVKEPEEIEE